MWLEKPWRILRGVRTAGNGAEAPNTDHDGTVPEPGSDEDSVLARIRGAGRGAVHEAIVRELHNVPHTGRARMVLIANSVHGEGASSVAQQTAAALIERTNGRVLLVDANLRSPSQHNSLGAELSPGLYDVALGSPPNNAVLCNELGDRFALLTAGHATQDPARLLSGALLSEAFVQLRDWFDWIVLDGPPVTIYAEAVTLGRLADATILVVRAESTRREVVQHAKKILVQSGSNLLGAILNRRRHHIPDVIYRHL